MSCSWQAFTRQLKSYTWSKICKHKLNPVRLKVMLVAMQTTRSGQQFVSNSRIPDFVSCTNDGKLKSDAVIETGCYMQCVYAQRVPQEIFHIRQSCMLSLGKICTGKLNLFSSWHKPTSKFVEVIANIEGLVVVISVLIVDEFHHSWRRGRGKAAAVTRTTWPTHLRYTP